MPHIVDHRTKASVYLSDEKIDLFMKEINEFHRTECQHDRQEIRLRDVGTAKPQLMRQCLECGQGKGGALAHTPDLLANCLPWDTDLADLYRAGRELIGNRIRDKYCDEALAEETASASNRRGFDLKYQEYLRSEEWQRKRSLVLRRAKGQCEGCMERPAEVIHHLSYQNRGRELLFELVALCHACHQIAHPEHHEQPLLEDFNPCGDCRWDSGGANCGRFEVLRYLALSPDGPCGPRWNGFEGLK